MKRRRIKLTERGDAANASASRDNVSASSVESASDSTVSAKRRSGAGVFGNHYAEALPLAVFRSDIWRGKFIVAAATLAGIIVATVITLLTPVSYDAQIVVAPVNPDPTPANQQIRSLAAAVTGVNIDSGRDFGRFDRFQHMLSSVSVAELMQQQHHVLQTLYAAEWDAAAQRWVPPHGLVAGMRRIVLGLFGLPGWAPPSAEQLANGFSRSVKIVNDPRSSVISITYSNKDPELAMNILRWIWEESDGILRERDQRETQQQIAYIDDKLRTVQVEEHRRALSDLLLELERKAMITAIDQPYAATIIDGPEVPDLPSSPRPILGLALGVMGGLIVGCTIAVYRGRRNVPRVAERS